MSVIFGDVCIPDKENSELTELEEFLIQNHVHMCVSVCSGGTATMDKISLSAADSGPGRFRNLLMYTRDGNIIIKCVEFN